jgi:peptide/nickel transport system substrate-binding protein
MDPYMFNEALLLNFDGNIYEALVGRGKKLELVPELATEWKNTAPTIWRFKLRERVHFHDGSPFTADDVIFSLGRARDASSDVKAYVAPIKEIRKIDAYTIDIITHQPFPILPDTIALWYILPKKWCEQNNAVTPVDVRKGTENYASNHANGTGPFMLKFREPGVRTVLVPNLGWWGKPEHNITEATFIPIANAATRTAALISGEIEMMQPVPLQDLPRIEVTSELKILKGMEARTIFFGMDQKRDELLASNVKGRNPFKDQRVRRAFYQAIDADAIKTRVMRGASSPAGLMVAPEVNGFLPELNRRLPYDPEAARRLLGEAGYPHGFELTLNCPSDRYVNDSQICQAVAAMLARIGVNINLVVEPKAIYFPRVLRGEVSFYMGGWMPASLDSHNVLFALMATPGEGGQGQVNAGGYSNARVDELTRFIASETNRAKREAMIAEAFKIHADEIGHLPLHQQPLLWGMKKSVEVVQLATNFNYLKWVVVK